MERLKEILQCILYGSDVFDIYNLFITIVYVIIFFIYELVKLARRGKLKDKDVLFVSISDLLRKVKSKKAFIFFWASFIVLNFVPFLCVVKHKVELLEKQRTKLQNDVKVFQTLLIEASNIMNMSEDYYEKMRKQLILYPPNIRLSVTQYKIERDKAMKKFILEDMKGSKKCLSFIQKIRRNKNLPPTYAIEQLKEAKKSICKNSYYVSYLLGLNALKLDNLQEAESYLSEAVRIAEKKGIFDFTLYHTYAQVFLLLEKYDDAEKFLKKALSFCPCHPYADAHLRVLKDLRNISNYKKQIREFKKKLRKFNGLE